MLRQRLRDRRNSMKNMSFYLLASFIPMAFNLLLSPLYALNLSAEDFAIVGYFASFQGIFGPLVLFEMHQNYMREYYFRAEEGRDSLRTTMFKTFLVFPFIMVLLSLVVLYIYFNLSGAIKDMPFFPYAILTFLPWALAGIYRLELIDCKVQRKAKEYFNISVTNSAILIISTVLCVVVFKWGATGKLMGAFIPALAMFVWSFWRHKDSLQDKIDWGLLKSTFMFCTPLVLAAMVDFFLGGYDKVFLQRYVSLDELGIYTIGLTIASYLGVFSTAMGETFNPDIYESIAHKDNKRALKIMLLQLIIMLVIVIVFIVLARFIIYVLTAGRYVASTPYARIASIAAITTLIRGFITPFIYAAQKNNILLISKVITGVLAIIGYGVLIKYYGIMGAVWGTVLCPLIYALIAFSMYKISIKQNR